MNVFWNFASHDGAEWLALLAGSAIKATVLLSLVALFCTAFRLRSAATRHLLWTIALCGSLLLPFLSSTLNIWQVPIPLERSAAGSSANLTEKSNAAIEQNDFAESLKANENRQEIHRRDAAGSLVERQSAGESNFDDQSQTSGALLPNPTVLISEHWINLALIGWGAGALLLFFRLTVGYAAAKLLARRAREFQDEAWANLFSNLLTELKLKRKVRLLCSERILMPIVCGVLRPAVLLPAGADRWSEERRRMVLLHELTHVARRDCLTQIAAQIACAFYWFNPLVWHAARRLRIERERACDDFVLSVGAKPSDYAHHLLEIARLLRERSIFEWSQTTTVAMARQSELEGRLLAILDKENNRRAMSRLMTLGAAGFVCVFLLTLAVVSPTIGGAQNLKNDVAAKMFASEESSAERELSPDSQLKERAEIRDANQPTPKQKHANGVEKTAPESPLTDARIHRDIEPDVARNVERDVEQDIAEDTARIQPTPEAQAGLQVQTTVSPFINITYRQERNSERQEKSQDFIDEMASVGYLNLSVDELIYLKTHGVTAEFVRSLRAYGLNNVKPKELANMRIHGVTKAFIEGMRAAGYKELTAKDLSNLRIHGVTPEYVKKMQDFGFANLPAKQLIEFRIHNVAPEFISGIRAAGYNNLSPRELVTLRVHGVTPEFVRKARSRLGELTVKQLISLKNANIINDDSDKNKE